MDRLYLGIKLTSNEYAVKITFFFSFFFKITFLIKVIKWKILILKTIFLIFLKSRVKYYVKYFE